VLTLGKQIRGIVFVTFFALQACSANSGGMRPAPTSVKLATPKSLSPGIIPAPPMALTKRQSAQTLSKRFPKFDIGAAQWVQLTGGASQISVAGDGSFWVLSPDGPNAGDKYIYHNVNGVWTNVSGAAARISAAQDGSLWVVNSLGGIYHYSNGTWNPIAGGAKDISVAADGTIYVISKAPGNAGIYHYDGANWTQLPGAGTTIAASPDTANHGVYGAGGVWITTSDGQIYYYYSSFVGFMQFNGKATQIVPTKNGGIFTLGFPAISSGNPLYYNNLDTGDLTQIPGGAVNLATDSNTLYAVSGSGGIYRTSVQLPLTQTVNVAVSGSGSANGTYLTQPYDGTVSFPATTSGSATLTTVVASTIGAASAPLGAAIASSPPGTSGAFLCVTASSTVTLSGYPTFAFAVPTWYNAANDAAMYLSLANPIAGNTWTTIGKAAARNYSQFSLTGPSGGPTLIGGQTYCFALSGLTTPLPLPSAIVVTAAGVPAWNATQHTGYVAISYNGNLPQYIGIYAPGQSTASTIMTVNGCCVEQLQFDSNGNLLVATTQSGILKAPPGATDLSSFLPSQSGFSLGINAADTLAVGGYNMGVNVAVYPAESAAAKYSVPGQPAFSSLAVSPSSEVAVPQSNGSVMTYPRGSTTANRTLNFAGLLAPSGINSAVVAYDANNNLAVSGFMIGTVSVFAPGATTASYSIPGLLEAQALNFDGRGRLIIGTNTSIVITVNGQTKITLPNVSPVYMNVGVDGSFGYAGYNSASQVFQADGRITTINTPYQSLSIAISP